VREAQSAVKALAESVPKAVEGEKPKLLPGSELAPHSVGCGE